MNQKINDKIKLLFEIYELSKTKGLTLLDWHRGVDLLREIIDAKRNTLEKWLN